MRCSIKNQLASAILIIITFITGCEKEKTPVVDASLVSNPGQTPTVIEAGSTNITGRTARLTGSVNANYLSAIVTFEYGPTTNYGSTIIANQNPVSGGSPKTVTADISGLKSAETYHYRIRAENPVGITFGNDLTFSTILSDIEGNVYNTVMIGSQVWMKENLRTTRYRNGDRIETTSSPTMDLTNALVPKYQWPCNIAENGRYYTYYVITDNRNICPVGWHIPSDSEWTNLTDYLINNGYGYKDDAQAIAKSLAATSGWATDPMPGNVGNDQPANNSSGFAGVSSGGRYSNGVINFAGYHGIWWTSTESLDVFAYFRCIGYLPGDVYRGIFKKSYGLPVRCLRD